MYASIKKSPWRLTLGRVVDPEHFYLAGSGPETGRDLYEVKSWPCKKIFTQKTFRFVLGTQIYQL
jgi:hypothetical protein